MKKANLILLFMIIFSCALCQKRSVIITTEYGKIIMQLYDKTPLHRDNMIRLVKEKFYDGTLFHRVIPEFVIQGGDPDSKSAKPGQALGDGDVGYKIPAEINDEYFHQRGAVGMAREDNPEKASSGCQFYIVIGKVITDSALNVTEKRTGHTIPAQHREVYKTIGGTPHLDGNYTVFGMVTKGMDIVCRIAALPRNKENRPDKDIRMIKVRMKKKFLFF